MGVKSRECDVPIRQWDLKKASSKVATLKIKKKTQVFTVS